ncbi:MAG: T9SS type A sorting domain-containing protein, partial [Rhodothermales bacterium]|nr:T9SS type A sorting domain-containing protein [Rhodothermales bacterium]
GPAAAAAEPRGVPPLHAPRPWVTGSSYSHLSELEIGGVEFYPPGEPNSLMTPFLGGAEGIHSPGAVTCGLLWDTGWEMGPACLALLEEAGDSGPAGAPAVACELDGPVLPDFEARQQCDAFTDEPVCGPYPNPVSAVGGVDVSLLVALEVEDPVRVALYDAVGRRVRAFERTPEAGKLTVSVAGFPSGVYFIHVEGGGIDETRPLTVLR